MKRTILKVATEFFINPRYFELENKRGGEAVFNNVKILEYYPSSYN